MPEKRLEANSEPGAVQTLRELVENLDRLENDYRATVERHRKFQRIVLGAAVLIAVAIGGLGYVAVSVRSIVTYMASCQTPEGECAKQSAKRTGAAIKKLNDDSFSSNIYFGVCAREYPGIKGPEYENKLRACVEGKRKAADTPR